MRPSAFHLAFALLWTFCWGLHCSCCRNSEYLNHAVTATSPLAVKVVRGVFVLLCGGERDWEGGGAGLALEGFVDGGEDEVDAGAFRLALKV